MRDSSDDMERRKCRALRRLNSNDPKCFRCGEDDWRCLEAHHIAGERYDAMTVVVCRNCHRRLSDDQLDHPTPAAAADPQLTQIAHFMLGLADALAALIERLRAFAADLIDRAGGEPEAAPVGRP